MPTVVQFTEPGRVELVPAEIAALPPGHLRVQTWYSGISAGTELTAYRGSNPYFGKSWDSERHLFSTGTPLFHYPVQGWGYSEVGEVTEVAPDVCEVRTGDVVAGIWGHRSEGVIPADAPHRRTLPSGMHPLDGVFARPGAIALNAVLAADARIGENIAVFGQGVLGLLATQLVRLSGAHALAVDTLASRRELARRHGATVAIDAGVAGGAGPVIREHTRGLGADSAIDLSGSYAALHEAIRSVVVDGKVVASSFYQGEGQGLRLGEEFHHNRIQIVASQISGAPLSLGPRWDQRRLVTTFLDEVAAGNVVVGDFVSHLMDAAEVTDAFELLDRRPDEALQVVLRFPGAPGPR